MAYTSYADKSDYINLNLTEIDNVEGALREASRHVDTLTFGRIQARGFDNLTEFQKEIIIEVVCKMAEFESINAEGLSSMIDSYSINGVNVKYSTGTMVDIINGIPVRRTIYELLAQTGLCSKRLVV